MHKKIKQNLRELDSKYDQILKLVITQKIRNDNLQLAHNDLLEQLAELRDRLRVQNADV
jgi:hypothetical protein